MKLLKAALAASLIALVALAPAGAAPAIDKSDNLKLVKNFAYDGGSELSASGRYVYSGEANAKGGQNRGTAPDDGGLHIFDIEKMKEVGFLHCPGTDNDVEVVRPGLVAMAFSQNMCAPSAGSGIMLIDVKNAAKPKIISAIATGDSHTMKPMPGGRYIYMNGGNLAGTAVRGGVIVDTKNPAKPEIAATPSDVMDCHDVSFKIVEEDRQLGFCAGAVGTGEVQIWDISDQLNPTVISRIVNPAIQYSHYAIANKDGTLLAIDDEAFAAHDCNTGASPTGRVWIYDISNPLLPTPLSSFAPPGGRGGDPAFANIGNFPGWVDSWCMSHGLDWHPKKNSVAVTWFTAGISVIDLTDPLLPTEAAYFDADDSGSYSALWHGGYLFSNDHIRGVDVLKIKGY